MSEASVRDGSPLEALVAQVAVEFVELQRRGERPGAEDYRVLHLAAAFLLHPSIVPVHAVGCERGFHFYAMQFIDGRNLDDLLQQLRRPAGANPASAAPDSPESQRTEAYQVSPEAPAIPAAATAPDAR